MKILQIGAFFHPSVGGVEKQMEDIAFNLKELGHEVIVCTTDATHDELKRMQRKDEVYQGVMVKRFPYHIAFGDFFRFSFNLFFYLMRADFDLMHVHNIHDGHMLPAILVRIVRRKKMVVTGHNPFVVEAQKRGDKLNLLVGFYDLVLKLFAGYIDAYLALVESEKTAVIKTLGIKPQKIWVIPNGIQGIFYEGEGNAAKFFQLWEIKPEKWDLIVGTVSRINFVKGIQNLEQAVKNLPKVLFIFAGGDDGYRRELAKLYRDCANVIFTERYLQISEVKDFYAAIDIFLLPSVYEPFGMTVVEAMAQAKMVMATSNGGPPEIINDQSGDILDPLDQNAWYQKLKFYKGNKEIVTEKSAQAQRQATKYQWPHVIRQIEAVYKQII